MIDMQKNHLLTHPTLENISLSLKEIVKGIYEI